MKGMNCASEIRVGFKFWFYQLCDLGKDNSDPQFNFEIGHDSTNNAQGFYKRESSSHI